MHITEISPRLLKNPLMQKEMCFPNYSSFSCFQVHLFQLVDFHLN